MPQGRRVSIAVVVTIALVATATALLGVFGFAADRTIRARQRHDLHTHHLILADELAIGLALPVWNFDRDQIDRIIEGAMREEDVAGIVVRLADQHHTVHARARDQRWQIQAAAPDPGVPGQLLETRRIVANKTDLGSVDVSVTPRFAEQRLARTRLSMLSAILALDVALILVLGLLLWRLVLEPLTRVELYAAAVRSGESPKTEWQGRPFRGEMESLRASIAAMIALLDRRYVELTTSQAATRVSEERFRSAMYYSPIGMALVGHDGRWQDVNPALCAILGYRRDELLASTSQAITCADDLAADLDAMRRLVAHAIETDNREKRYVHKDGRIIWAQLNVSLVPDQIGQAGYFVCQIQDITERKSAAAELVALHKRYVQHEAALTSLTRHYGADDWASGLQRVTEVVARTLDVVRVSIWRLADSATLVCEDAYDRPGQRHLSGMRLTSDVYPRLFDDSRESDIFAPADPLSDPRFADFAENYLRPLKIVAFMSAQIRSEGRWIGTLAFSDVKPRAWTPDEQTFAVAVASLISAQMAQSERQQVEAQLRHAQKMEAIGQLAGGVAHDFNNVLTVIQGKATQIAEDPQASFTVHQAASDIAASSERAAALTRQLLTFSRRQAVRMRIVDLNAVVANLARLLDRILGEDYSAELRYAAGNAYVRADPGMIDQVLLNLAVNARDAMPGGGRIGIEVSRVDVGPGTDARQPRGRAGSFACLEVRDTGEGISAEHLPHIFEPFFTTKDVGKGTGLGLATTYGIVQQHDGWIEVDSEVGTGTTFRVFLPRATAAPDIPAAPEAAPAAVSGSETILVVEDEHDVRTLVCDALTSLGYRVLEASSGPAALDVWHARGREIDLVITDMTMPEGMTGLQLVQALRRERPSVKVIFTSGYFADVSKDELNLGEGAIYLAKPFSLTELAHAVRQCADQGNVPLR